MNTETTGCTPRQHYLDRLKVLLTALVVFHHAAITYGAAGDWFYREPAAGHTLAGAVLTLFCAVNQSFFMGLFFLLAGYLTPASLQRKGPARFLRERLVRLGVPLLCFGFLLGPMTEQLAQGASWDRLGWEISTEAGARFVLGPLWFCWALLIFSVLYTGLAQIRPGLFWQKVPAPAAMLAGALGVGLVAFAVRLWLPAGAHVLGLQPGYCVSYTVLFMTGCMAARHLLLEQLTAAQIRPLVRAGLMALPVLPAFWLAHGAASTPVGVWLGGWNWPALVYALWEPLVAWGVISGLLLWGRRHLNGASQRWAFWTRHAYGAFVLHTPVLVALSVAATPLAAPTWLKFMVVASLATLLSFLAAAALRRIPGVPSIL